MDLPPPIPALGRTGGTKGHLFRPDVRLVRAPDRRQIGLQLGIRVVWLPAEIARQVWTRGPDLLGEEFRDLLETEGMLTSADEAAGTDTDIDRNVVFARAVCGASADLGRFRETLYVIAGCGGLGAQIAIQLAALGARRFTLIDGDQIERSNLNRLIFADLGDCGALKVTVLQHHLETRFGASVSVLPSFVGTTQDCIDAAAGPGGHFMVLSADGIPSVRAFLRSLYRAGRCPPYVHAGYVGSYCIAGPLAREPGDACPFCGSKAEIAGASRFVAPSALANNALISGFAVAQILLERTGGTTVLRGARWRFDLRNAESRLLQMPKRKGCEVCTP